MLISTPAPSPPDDSTKIAANAAVLSAAALASRVLGFARDLVIAYVLGAGPLADALFVALRLPNLMRRLFAEGSLSMAFVTRFCALRDDENLARAFAMTRSAFFWLLLAGGLLLALALLLASPLALLLAPGFTSDPALFSLTTDLVRICLPYTLTILAAALSMGVLNAQERFLIPALAPCVLNLTLMTSAGIAWIWGLAPARTLAWGMCCAGVLQWAMQQPALRKTGFAWRGSMRVSDPQVRRLAREMPPMVLGAAVFQINVLLSSILASFLAHGSISCLYYADRLVQFPLAVFGVAVGQAALPRLAALAGQQETVRFNEVLENSLRLSLFLALPATAGLIALASPVVAVLFGHGAFDSADISATAQALAAYSLGLPALALVRPLLAAYYARQDARTPVTLAAASIGLFLLLSLLLMPWLGHTGIALATSLASWGNVILLHRRITRLFGVHLAYANVLKGVLPGAFMALVVGTGSWYVAHTTQSYVCALLQIPFWGAAYVAAGRLLKLPEALLLFQGLRRG